MAHEISVVNVNGVKIVEAMYANKPAWHTLGTIFDLGGKQAPDSATAARLSHTEWKTQLEEMVLESDGEKVEGYFANVRQDTRETLGVLKGRYRDVQNEECYSLLDSLCQDDIIRYESAFALNGGRQVVMLCRMPSCVDDVAEGDKSLRYIMLHTTHDGTGFLTLTPTWVRVVCANTVRIALSDKRYSVRIRHSGDIKAKMAEARRYVSQFDVKFTEFRDTGRLLATRQVTGVDVKAYLHTLFPEPVGEDISRTVKNNWQDKINGVQWNFNHVLPSVKGTWWGLFNSVTQYVDHQSKFRGEARVRQERLFDETMNGSKADFKNEAWELAVAMAL